MELSITQDQITLIALSAVASWGFTQVVKPFIKDRLEKPKAIGAIRGLALLVGAIVGASLDLTAQGLWLGLAAGALNTVIVAKVKEKLK